MATNPKKKYNKSADILAFLRDNPAVRNIVAAQRFGITVASVYKYRKMLSGAIQNTVLHLVPDMEVKEDHSGYAVSDHAEAAASMLANFAKRLRTGTSPEDIGPQVILAGRMMARLV